MVGDPGRPRGCCPSSDGCAFDAGAYSDGCTWVKPLRHVRPPPQEVLQEHAAGLNPSQRRALFLTRQHSLVLVQGPPGTGKTQMATAATQLWTDTLGDRAVVLAAAPSNVAANQLLDLVSVEIL